MNKFRQLLRIIDGRDSIPPKLAEAMQSDAVLSAVVTGAREEAQTSAPNWAAIIAIVMQLLPVILPLL